MEHGVQVTGVDHRYGFLLGDHALVHQIAGDLQSGGGGALAVTGLQHIQLAVFHGELHILHIAVVVLQRLADLLELPESLWEFLSHLTDGHGGAHAGDHVLALRIGQELTHQLLFAGGGVAGESNAGAAVVAHVAEGHGLHVDGGAPRAGDVVHTAVHDSAGVVPGAEHGLDGAHQLFLRIGGEVGADLGFVLGLELAGQLLQIPGSEFHVLRDATLGLHLVDEFLKIFLADFHNHVGIHLDKTTVAVPSPAGVVGFIGDDFYHILVQTQVQDGIHHAGHGGTCTGTNGDQQGVLQIAELLAGDRFYLGDILHDLRLDLVVDLFSVFIILGAGLGGDRKALRYGHTQIGHFGQIGALATQKLTHLTIALGEKIHILVFHLFHPSFQTAAIHSSDALPKGSRALCNAVTKFPCSFC